MGQIGYRCSERTGKGSRLSDISAGKQGYSWQFGTQPKVATEKGISFGYKSLLSYST